MNTTPRYLFEDIGFGQTNSPRPARFDGYDCQSLYISMRDGTRLAADMFLPLGLPPGERLLRRAGEDRAAFCTESRQRACASARLPRGCPPEKWRQVA